MEVNHGPELGPVPREGFLPKQWIGATEFLSKNAAFDGRGVVVGVLDTGVDPGAAGLSETTDGKRKILDIVDCTGGGDVDSSTVVQENEDGTITGLSGRTLTLGEKIRELNPSGKYHIGIKSAYELFPRNLITRIRRERRDKWTEQQRLAKSKARPASGKEEQGPSGDPTPQKKLEQGEVECQIAQLKAMEKDYKDPGQIFDCVVFNDGENWRAIVDSEESGQLAHYKILENYRLNGVYATFGEHDLLNYCVNIYDEGNVLSIVVDAGHHGTHVAGTIAANYPDNPEMNGVAPGCQIVSLKIGDSRLGSMETHQGLIRAMAYLTPDDSENDRRRHKIDYCDALNMSYGEATSRPDSGRFIEMARELVEKHNVMFIFSAGNAGPGITTGTAPGGTSSVLIGIGAYVTPEMATQAYSYIDEEFYQVTGELKEPRSETEDLLDYYSDNDSLDSPCLSGIVDKRTIGAQENKSQQNGLSGLGVPGIPYTWCSRGPTPHGAMGVNLCAPGGAIAPVPEWTLRKKMLLNGTSMAAPSATGSVALLLCMCKSKGIKYTSHRVRIALENSAKPLLLQNLSPSGNQLKHPDRFGSGAGSVNVPLAADLLEQSEDTPELDVQFSMSYMNGTGIRMSGIYLRDIHDSRLVRRFMIQLDCMKSDDDSAAGKAAASRFESLILLKSTAAWVKTPKSVALFGGGRSFPVTVDPTGLDEGEIHFAEILGYKDGSNSGSGPLFRFPVTVIKPLDVEDEVSRTGAFVVKNLEFGAGEVNRIFLHVPSGASHCTISMNFANHFPSSHNEGKAPIIRRFVIQTVQIVKERSPNDTRLTFYDSVAAGMVLSKQICVEDEQTLEICVSQLWSSPGTTVVDKVRVIFGGLDVYSNSLNVGAGSLCSDRFDIINRLKTNSTPRTPCLCEPKAVLTHLERSLAPTSSTLKALGERDILPKNRQIYELILTYNFSLAETAELKIHFPGLSGRVYESVLEGGPFHMIFDSSKKLCYTADCYPSAKKLEKGKGYVLRAAIRHENTSYLDELKSLSAILRIKLGSDVSLECFSTQQGALLGLPDKKTKNSSWNDVISPGEKRPLYFSAPKRGSIPKHAVVGDSLVGSVTVDKTPNKGGGPRTDRSVKHYNLSWEVGPALARDGGPSTQAQRKDKKPAGELTKSKAQLDELRALLKDRQFGEFDEKYRVAIGQKSDYVPFLSIRLERLEEAAKDNPNPNVQEILNAADAVVEKISTEGIAAALYPVVDSEDESEVSAREEAEKNRRMLCQALLRKLRILKKSLDAMKDDDDMDNRTSYEQTFESCFKQLRKWNADMSAMNAEVSLMTAERERIRSRFACGLKALGSLEGPTASKEVLELRRRLLVALNWRHVVEYEDRWRLIRNPKSYTLF
ncbi:hypothetical protein NDN08_008299 [Rhodosorus marinus]|uniref:tripeptidyl-peptidase II n=1 Tax=Rhodosorus marinus TaxID=101924 RepID=A0AAV8V2T9_9RHOD|nr:hypothetical protein NDN08_008299 [Rhodosorus marinus]